MLSKLLLVVAIAVVLCAFGAQARFRRRPMRYYYHPKYQGSYGYPDGCYDQCDYKVRWAYSRISDKVRFTVFSKVPRGKYASIGFSTDGDAHGKSDVFVGYGLKNGTGYIFDDRTIDGLSVVRDEQQNGKLYYFRHFGGRLMYTFRRKRDTGDPADVSLKQCVYLLYAWGGDGLANGTVTAHTNGSVSKDKVCFGPTM